MKRETILESIEKIDETYIDKAMMLSGHAEPKKHTVKWGAVVAIAACLVLAGATATAVAAEAIEYNSAVAYLNESGISTDGMTRAEVKAARREEEQNFEEAKAFLSKAGIGTEEMTHAEIIERYHSEKQLYEAALAYFEECGASSLKVTYRERINAYLNQSLNKPLDTLYPPRCVPEGVYAVEELVYMRGECTKQFKLSDGTILAENYGYPIHYRDENGVWQELPRQEPVDPYENEDVWEPVELELHEVTKEDGSTVLQSDVPWGLFEFPVTLENGGRVTFGNGAGGNAYEAIRWDIVGDNTADVRHSVEVSKLYSQNQVSATKVKETVTLNEPCENFVYERRFYADITDRTPFSPKLKEDGSIVWTLDDRNAGVLYKMPAPRVYDASGEEGTARVEMDALEDGGYSVRIVPDAAWLNDPARTFPVTVETSIRYVGPLFY